MFSRILPKTKQYIQQCCFQQFNLVECFSHKQFRTFNHKCSNKLMFSISYIKLLKKIEINVDTHRFINSNRQQEKIVESVNVTMLEKARQKSSHLVQLSYLHIKAGQKSSSPVFYPVLLLISTASKVSQEFLRRSYGMLLTISVNFAEISGNVRKDCGECV